MIIDYSNCLSFIEENDISIGESEALLHLNSLKKGPAKGADFLGWLTLPEEAENQVDKIISTSDRLRSQAGISVVIGIGGSYLGSKAVLEAMIPQFRENADSHQILYAGHHLSEDYHANLISHLKDKVFNIIVISKSGTTTEPAVAFRLLRNLLEKNIGRGKVASHIVAITDKSRGALRTLADQEGFESFVIPDNVGGRYSVLTPVGLLPIACAGIDIRKFIEGARDMARLTRDKSNTNTNPALKYAALRNILLKKGYMVEMLVNYEPQLQYLGEWWKQLFGESEGKEGKGIFPASANFTTDLHSLGQYIQEGQRFIFETVISVSKSKDKLTIPFDEENLDKLNYISGKRLSEVNLKAEQGTVMAHVEGEVPVIRLEIEEINEYSFGELLYFFEISCAISGYQLGVNPFDQPGVEAYKRNMFKLLGKEGY